MSHAVIVVGNEPRFMRDARAFARYLREQARCARVSVIRGANLFPAELDGALDGALRAVPRDEPLLLAYFGHGHRDGWGYALEHQEKYFLFPYEALAAKLGDRRGPLVVLNDCCHAESIVPRLEGVGVTPDRCLVISACAADEVIGPGTGEEVVKAWSDARDFMTIKDEIHEVDMTPYEPPMHVRAGRRWKNARVRLRNMFLPRRAGKPAFIFVNSPPNGWAKHRVTVTTMGLRWGASLDRLFFPKTA